MKFTNTIKTLSAITLAVLISVTTANAIGSLTPSGTAGDDTQYSLNDIYTKLTTGATTTEDSGTMTVPGTVSASFHTLSEIYALLQAEKLISPANIVTGTTIFELVLHLQEILY